MVNQYVYRNDGSIIKFNNNRILLFSKNETSNKFLGSRIYGFLMKEVKSKVYKNKKEKQKYFKAISYAKSII